MDERRYDNNNGNHHYYCVIVNGFLMEKLSNILLYRASTFREAANRLISPPDTV